MPSRRRFLALSAASLACAAAPRLLWADTTERLGIPVFSEAASGAAKQGLLTAAAFERLIGSSFHAFLDAGVVAEIVLRKVTVPKFTPATTYTPSIAASIGTSTRPVSTLARAIPRTTTAFMLSFSSGSTLIPQNSYTLDHGTLGSFAAFLVPAQPVPGDQIAVATFNFL